MSSLFFSLFYLLKSSFYCRVWNWVKTYLILLSRFKVLVSYQPFFIEILANPGIFSVFSELNYLKLLGYFFNVKIQYFFNFLLLFLSIYCVPRKYSSGFATQFFLYVFNNLRIVYTISCMTLVTNTFGIFSVFYVYLPNIRYYDIVRSSVMICLHSATERKASESINTILTFFVFFEIYEDGK
jgi:hypothetical protein